ncbi:hypothetical protein B7P43_G10738 [Cryptotermes secundus]|uniref:DUF4772 domain-containing protein n=1 Tax=Cryptotermes secundus TaxID=105785 RepID=A0A2J7R139_9NEOP|nr:hypothetical protein B7P43_G10738 [Cryptotermes secundus]
MSTGKRLAKRSIIGTRVCAQGEDGKFYSGVIHAVKTPGNSDTFANSAGETRYSVRFDPLPGNSKRLASAMREYRETELIGPGFQAVTGFKLQPGQKVFLTYNGREVSGEVTSHQPHIDEVIVNITPPGYEDISEEEFRGPRQLSDSTRAEKRVLIQRELRIAQIQRAIQKNEDTPPRIAVQKCITVEEETSEGVISASGCDRELQREFRARFQKDAPHKNNTIRWYRQFVETGCLCKGKSRGRPRVSDDNIERVRVAFQRSPRKSVGRGSRELGMSKMTESKVLRKRLCFKPYKMLLVQALTPTDKVKTCDFCEEMQLKMEENRFVGRLISDEATFHISGKVNRHNVRIWGIEQPHAQVEHQRDSPKVNIFCAVSRDKVHGQFFIAEASVTIDSFLDMLESWLLPQLNTSDYQLPKASEDETATSNERLLYRLLYLLSEERVSVLTYELKVEIFR